MQFSTIETEAINVVRQASGSYLFPYQVFYRIRQLNPALGQQIEAAYPVQPGNPVMGEGAGRYYSAASFVAHALNHFRESGRYPELDKRWFDAADLEVDGIVPGNKENTSIWSWDPRTT